MAIHSQSERDELRDKYGLGERTLTDRLREGWIGYLFILPTFVSFAALFYYPMFLGIQMSFQEVKMADPNTWVGIENYVWVLTNDVFYYAFGWTMVFAFTELLFVMLIGLLIALLVNELARGYREWTAAFLMSPYFSAPVLGGVIWFWFLSPTSGFINRILRGPLGMEPISFLATGLWPFVSLIVAQTWHDYAYAAIIYIPALQGIPASQYEAAAISGAGKIKRFRDITLPHLATPTIIILAIRTSLNITEFAQPFELTGGGPGTRTMILSILMVETAFQANSFGRGIVIGFVMTVVSLTAALIYITTIEEEEDLYT